MVTIRSRHSNTKQRLRDEAIEIVAQSGLAALSIRGLCQAVGIRESSFYSHFRAKEELLEQLLIDTGADTPHAVAARLAAQRLPVAQYVDQLTEELLAIWSSPTARKHRAVMEAEAAQSPELRERFNDGVLAMIDAVAQTLAGGVATGELTAHASPRSMAWSLVAPIAALRATFLAFGASDRHVEVGHELARAHSVAWLRAHQHRGTR